MRNRQGIGNIILVLLVESLFVYQGIKIFLQGQYFFAIVWIILCGMPLLNSLKALFAYIKDGVITRRIDRETCFQAKDEFDVYGHRTQASYEKQRLRKVEELYRDGLLSKAEYEEKRKDIIDHI